ncbi:hypothetical protein CBR_g3574 [Chara braunii]|uniref:Pectate lyase n=1 Tax=Chara braunii TaxID=69332 RepID=A0A388KFT3_CHABU|nr:hypothetical protein CBR_g3574 [Chara braunii]|eukprot:GBG68876.1 hypothetical protein CBR_g3574 [Chara braunii]
MAASHSAFGADTMILLFFVSFLLLVGSPVSSVASASTVEAEEGSGAHRKLRIERQQREQEEMPAVQMNVGEEPKAEMTSAALNAAEGSHDSALRQRRTEQVFQRNSAPVTRRRLDALSGPLLLVQRFGSSGGGGGGGYFGYGQSTSGGAGGEVVYVTSYEDSGINTLRYFCGLSGAKIIKFQEDCTIALKSRVECTNDKTVDGSGYQVRITGWGLSANRVSNVVFRNLCVKNTRLDGITARLSSNIVIEGCSFSGIGDGAVDIITHSSGVSILRNHFMGILKTILAGNSDSDSGDKSMTVTVAFNHFDNCGSRQPRVRFATVHVCANVYSKWGHYAIGASKGARLLVENCFFHSGGNEYVNNFHEGENDGTVIDYRNNEYNGAKLLLQSLGSVDVPNSCPAKSESSITSEAGVPYAC